MSRFTTLLSLAMVLTIFGNTLAHAQLAMETGIPPELMILQSAPDETWQIMNDATGTPLVFEGAQLVAGIPQYELNPLSLGFYDQFQTQDVYIHQASFINTGYEAVATQVEMRVITFLDTQNASDYLNGAYDNQLEATAGAEFDPQFSGIDPLPQFAYPLIGWTRVIDYVDNSSEDYSGLTSAVRYQAQLGQVVISAQVVGPFVDYNFDLAMALLAQQASCVESDSPCEGISLSAATDHWQMSNGVLTFASEGVEARWMYPVEGPVLAPELSATIGGVEMSADTDAHQPNPRPVTIVGEGGPVLGHPTSGSEEVDHVVTGDVVSDAGTGGVLLEGVLWISIITERGVEGWIPISWVTYD